MSAAEGGGGRAMGGGVKPAGLRLERCPAVVIVGAGERFLMWVKSSGSNSKNHPLHHNFVSKTIQFW